MNYQLLVVIACAALANSTSGSLSSEKLFDDEDWESFKREYGKNYADADEELMRRIILGNNKRLVNEFNSNRSAKAGFKLGINHLSDLDENEAWLSFGLQDDSEEALQNTLEEDKFLAKILNDDSIPIPDELDWREIPGRVTRVKNQKQCGSCWAFASTGLLEGQEFRLNTGSNLGMLIELSEQNLVDCVALSGCQGGSMVLALEYVRAKGGVNDERSYPYIGQMKKCRFNEDNKVALTISGFARLPNGDEQTLKAVVARHGPVAVSFYARGEFMSYKEGIYYNKHWNSSVHRSNHAVLIVGYGKDEHSNDYWIVKNSWGPKWGEAGYFRMARNRNNNCGIATRALIATY